MKTADGKNPNRWATMPGNRAHGAEGQNKSCSIKWAEKAENFSRGEVFFLDFPFYRTFLDTIQLIPAHSCQRKVEMSGSTVSSRGDAQAHGIWV
jgi:hypothetical protein